MKIQLTSGVVLVAVFVLAGTGYAGEKCGTCTMSAATNTVASATVKTQTNCPVMGGAVDKSIFVDADGKRIYLCCKGCVATVTKDPKKYIDKLEAEGITLDKTPVKEVQADNPTAK